MAAPGQNLRINGERLWDSLMEMAKIGPGVAGGNNRQTLTDQDGVGRVLFQRWCEAAGMTMGLDARWARCLRGAREPMRARFRSMSARISTPSRQAANTTGCSGCWAALEIIRTLNDLDIKTKASDRRDQLDQRGRHAVRAADAGLGGFWRDA